MTDQFPEYGEGADSGKVPYAELRATDADRKRVAKRLRAAAKSGELTEDEFHHRNDAVQRARTYGDLGELTVDLAEGKELGLPDAGTPAVRGAGGGLMARVPGTVRAWIFVAIITNVVWLITVLSGEGLYYYWPIWPMGGMLIPILAQVIFGGDERRDED